MEEICEISHYRTSGKIICASHPIPNTPDLIPQPWAWLIVNGYKDIENRSWSTKYRGLLLVHASAKKPSADFLLAVKRQFKVKFPDTFDLGGIVSLTDVVDCVTESRSRWMEGPIGWKLKQAQPIPFTPVRGKLGLFKLEKSEFDRLKRHLPPDLR